MHPKQMTILRYGTLVCLKRDVLVGSAEDGLLRPSVPRPNTVPEPWVPRPPKPLPPGVPGSLIPGFVARTWTVVVQPPLLLATVLPLLSHQVTMCTVERSVHRRHGPKL